MILITGATGTAVANSSEIVCTGESWRERAGMHERYASMQPKGEIVMPSVSWLRNARRAEFQ